MKAFVDLDVGGFFFFIAGESDVLPLLPGYSSRLPEENVSWTFLVSWEGVNLYACHVIDF